MLLRHKSQNALLCQSLTKFLPTAFLHRFSVQPSPGTSDICNSYTYLLRSHRPQINTIEQTHARIITQGLSQTSFSATHLVKSYAKAGNLESSSLVFRSAIEKSVFLWNAMIRALSCNELWEETADLYRRMKEENVEPDCYTLPFVIKAFAVLSAVDDGKKVHDLAGRIGLSSNVYVATALIGMYLKFGEIDNARQVFDEMPESDVVSWTAMISGYCENGNYTEALVIFKEMMRMGDVNLRPNSVTILSLIPACNYSIHAFVIKSGLGFSLEVETAIFDMYAKSGNVEIAHDLFDQMPQKTLISWTAMLAGYSQNGHAHEALVLFNQMLKFEDLKPDPIVAAIILQACAQLGSLNHGQMIHSFVLQSGFQSELQVGTALVDMYAKCGSIEAAESVFDGISDKNIITWCAMIAGYGVHGLGYEALDLFKQMKKEGFEPDEAIFLSVLSACSHSGLIREGKAFFNSMTTPRTKHYACMVDLLGRAGLIEEARSLIEEMPGEPDSSIWGALLSACRFKGNVEVAEFACRRLLELDPDNTEYHVLLANVYAGCGRWFEVSKVRSGLSKRGIGKTPGCSYVEVDCRIHVFVAGDRSHPQSKAIY